MKVTELTREQLIQLKQQYLMDTHETVNWGELAEADGLVTDETIFEYYGGTEFVEEDFTNQ